MEMVFILFMFLLFGISTLFVFYEKDGCPFWIIGALFTTVFVFLITFTVWLGVVLLHG